MRAQRSSSSSFDRAGQPVRDVSHPVAAARIAQVAWFVARCCVVALRDWSRTLDLSLPGIVS